MKKFLIAASIFSAGIARAEIDFFAKAPDFYDKEKSVLSASAPIATYNKLIRGDEVSPKEAAKAYKELRAILSIRNAIGNMYTGPGYLERRTGFLGGLFGFRKPEDYTDTELDDIKSKLVKAAGIDNAQDPLESIRTKITKTIPPDVEKKDKTKLNKLVELEALWDTDEKNAENREQILGLAEEIGIKKDIENLLPEAAASEPEKKEHKPAAEEPKAPTGYNFSSPDFYKNDTGGVLYNSEPVVTYRDLLEKSKKAIAPALFKEFRALREIKKAIQGARSTANEGEYSEFALNIINEKLAEASKQKDAPDTFAPLRASIVAKIKGDNSKLNHLIELEKIWGSTEENVKNQEALLKIAQKIGVEKEIENLLPKAAASEPEKKEEKSEKIPQKRLLQYLDNITSLLLGETGPTPLKTERKDLYDLVAKIIATKPKDAELKDINGTALKIINAVDAGTTESFDWSKEIEAPKEERPKQVLNEKDVPWIIIPKVGQKGPIDLLSSQDFDEKTQQSIAGFFKSVKDFVSNNNSRIWADYNVINVSPATIDSTAKESTDKRIKELAQLTKNEPANRAYPIYEEALTEHLLNLIAGKESSAPSPVDTYYDQWIERTRNIIAPKSSKMADDLVDKLALIIFAEKFVNKELDAATLKEQWIKTIEPFITLSEDEKDDLNDSLKDGLEFLEHARQSKLFSTYKDQIVKKSLDYIKGSAIDEATKNLLSTLKIALPGEAKVAPGGVKMPGAEEIKAKKIAAETSLKEIILSLEKLCHALQTVTLAATQSPK